MRGDEGPTWWTTGQSSASPDNYVNGIRKDGHILIIVMLCSLSPHPQRHPHSLHPHIHSLSHPSPSSPITTPSLAPPPPPPPHLHSSGSTMSTMYSVSLQSLPAFPALSTSVVRSVRLTPSESSEVSRRRDGWDRTMVPRHRPTYT